MKITFLGTATSQGIPIIGCDCATCQSTDSRDKRLRVSILVEVEGGNILVDIGPDFRTQMLRAGVQDLEAILVTHEHNDHVAGLDDVRPLNFKHNKDIDVYTMNRVNDNLKKRYDYIFHEHPYPGIPQVKLHDIDKNTPFTLAGQRIVPIEVMHYKLPVLGFRFGNFTYITDAKTIAPEELEKVKGSKILVLNALRREEHLSHLTIDQAIDIINIVQPEQAYLTHFSHTLGQQADVEKTLPEGVFMAYDGLVLDIV